MDRYDHNSDLLDACGEALLYSIKQKFLIHLI